MSMLHVWQSTMSCDLDMPSSALPLIHCLTSPVPLFVDLGIYYEHKPNRNYIAGERAKWGTYKTPEERHAAKLARNKRWSDANPQWYEQQKEKNKQKRLEAKLIRDAEKAARPPKPKRCRAKKRPGANPFIYDEDFESE